MRITQNLIREIINRFDDPETQNLLQAMEVELKRGMRRTSDRGMREFLEQLTGQIYDENVWESMDFMLGFSFDY